MMERSTKYLIFPTMNIVKLDSATKWIFSIYFYFNKP